MHIIDKISQEEGEDFIVNSNPEQESYNQGFIEAIRYIDIKNLINSNVISHSNPYSDLYSLFLDINSEAFFRLSNKSDTILTNLWVAKIMNQAKKILTTNPYLKFNKEKLNKRMLSDFVRLSQNTDNLSDLPNILMQIGVILIIEPYIANSRVDGVCFRLPNGIPVIGLSLRFSRLDNFWFTLIHELSHVHLHFDYLEKPIIEDTENPVDSEIERQANHFTKFIIVDKSAWRTCDAINDRKDNTLRKFAESQKVHPALIAGLIRHELSDFKIFSNIINNFDVKNIFFKPK